MKKADQKIYIFSKEILIEEILSLHHPKINKNIAFRIAESVYKYLHHHEIKHPEHQFLHQIIDKHFNKLGFISLTKNLPTLGLTLKNKKAENKKTEDLPVEVLEMISSKENSTRNTSSEKLTYQSQTIKVNLPNQALEFLNHYCLLKGSEGELFENANGFYYRFSKFVADFERKFDPTIKENQFEEIFFDLLASKRFLPHSHILRYFNNPDISLISDFYIPLDYQDPASIPYFLEKLFSIEKIGGRVNFDLNQFNPNSNTISAHHLLDYLETSLRLLKPHSDDQLFHQAYISIHHPEIQTILHYLTHQNKTLRIVPVIGLTDQFMKSLNRNKTYPLIDQNTKEIKGYINANQIFRTLCHSLRKTKAPHILFTDHVQNQEVIYKMPENLLPTFDGAEYLKPYDNSGLKGFINLKLLIKDYEINWELLKLTVHQSIHFLDNLIESIHLPIEECALNLKKFRKLSIGIIGLKELLQEIGLEDNPPKSLKCFHQIMQFIHKEANLATKFLAQKRNSITGLNQTKLNPEKPRRNSHLISLSFDPWINIFTETSSIYENFSLNSKQANKDQLSLKFQATFQSFADGGSFQFTDTKLMNSETNLMNYINQCYQYKIKFLNFMNDKPALENLIPLEINQQPFWKQRDLFKGEELVEKIKNFETTEDYFLPDQQILK